MNRIFTDITPKTDYERYLLSLANREAHRTYDIITEPLLFQKEVERLYKHYATNPNIVERIQKPAITIPKPVPKPIVPTPTPTPRPSTIAKAIPTTQIAKNEIFWVIMPTSNKPPFRIMVRTLPTPRMRARGGPQIAQILAVDNPDYNWLVKQGKDLSFLDLWLSEKQTDIEIGKLQRQLKKASEINNTEAITNLQSQIRKLNASKVNTQVLEEQMGAIERKLAKIADEFQWARGTAAQELQTESIALRNHLDELNARYTKALSEADLPRGYLRPEREVGDALNKTPSSKVYWMKWTKDLEDIAKKPIGYVMPTSGRKIGIIGSRRRATPADMLELLDRFFNIYKEGDIIISGGAKYGGDHFAKEIARAYKIPYIEHPAQWNNLKVPKYGLKVKDTMYGRINLNAGKTRNALIARDSDYLISLTVKDSPGGADHTTQLFLQSFPDRKYQEIDELRALLRDNTLDLIKREELTAKLENALKRPTIGEKNLIELNGPATTNKYGKYLDDYSGPKKISDLNIPTDKKLMMNSAERAKYIPSTTTKKADKLPLERKTTMELIENQPIAKPSAIKHALRNYSPEELKVRAVVEEYFNNLKTGVSNINRGGRTVGYNPQVGRTVSHSLPSQMDTYIGRPTGIPIKTQLGSVSKGIPPQMINAKTGKIISTLDEADAIMVRWLEKLSPTDKGYFGNPFRIEDLMHFNKVDEPTARAMSVSKFTKYMDDRLARDPLYSSAIRNLRGHNLGCFCKPSSCHGDVIAKYVDNLTPDQIPQYKLLMQQELGKIDSANARFFQLTDEESSVINLKRHFKAIDDINKILRLQGSGAAYDPATTAGFWERMGYKLDDLDLKYLSATRKIDNTYLRAISKTGDFAEGAWRFINKPWTIPGNVPLSMMEGVGRGTTREMLEWATEMGARKALGRFGTLGVSLGGKVAGGLITIAPELLFELAYNHFSNPNETELNLGALGTYIIPAGLSSRLQGSSHSLGQNYGTWGDYVMRKGFEEAGKEWDPNGNLSYLQHALLTLPRFAGGITVGLPTYFTQKIDYHTPSSNWLRDWMTDYDNFWSLQGVSREDFENALPYLQYQQNKIREMMAPQYTPPLGMGLRPAWAGAPESYSGISPGAWLLANRTGQEWAQTGIGGVGI